MIRSVVRAAYHVAAELLPLQALRCIVDRDFSDAMYTAAAKHDGAEQRAEYEAEHEVHEPVEADIRAFTITSLVEWMQTEKRTDVHVQCGHCHQVVHGLPGFATHMLTCDLKPKVGEKYCLLCGVQLGDEFHACPERINLTDEEYDEFITAARGHGEPGLTADEIVAVRGLIQERYGNGRLWCSEDGQPASWCRNAPHIKSPAASAESAAGSPAEVSDLPPSPSAGRSNHFEIIPLDDEHSIAVSRGFIGTLDVKLDDGQHFLVEAYEGGTSVQTLAQDESDGGEVLSW